ncbi:MAG: hypothetical protein IJN50_03265 [Clostridia bacterium]|nr:hypothetical protein [Clostridia bacterium]
MFIIFIGYVGIILGYKSNKNKMLSTIVIGFVLYSISQILTIIIIFIFGLFNPNVMNLINTTETINIETIKLLLYVAIGIYFTYIVALYLLGKKFLNRGINVD